MRKIRNKNQKTLILVALLLFVTIGYAYLSQLLTINGTSTIDNAEWDLHFENYAVTGANTITPTTAPDTSGNNKTTISYAAGFDTPGQVYEFTIDTVNGGTIDAMIKNYASTIKIGDGEELDATNPSNIPSYLNYSITYPDDMPIAANHLLAANTSETIKIHLEFKENISAEELEAAAGKSITLTVTANYYQTDGTEVVRPAKAYVVSNVDMPIGQALPNGVNKRSTPALAMADWATITGVENDTKPYYLKLLLADNKVSEAYIEFVISQENAANGMKTGTFAIRGAGATKIDGGGYNNDSIYYTDNVNLLKEVYDYDNHPGRCTDNTTNFNCYAAGVYVKVDQQGNIDANDGTSYNCHVANNGTSYCRSTS